MDEINYKIAELRRSLASTVCLIEDLDENHSIDIINMPDFSDKVDLRPSWMLNGQNRSGKPHVDAVLHPEQRDRGIPRSIPTISPEQLKSVELRKVDNKISTDINSSRGRLSDSSHERKDQIDERQVPIDVFKFQTHSPPPPSPPPLPRRQTMNDIVEPKRSMPPMRSNTLPVTDLQVEVEAHKAFMTSLRAEQHALIDRISAMKSELDDEMRTKQLRNSPRSDDQPPTYKSKDEIAESDCNCYTKESRGKDCVPHKN
jgi:hypothetical protein